uniref:Transposase Tc1-like domain-containing protein n=1 Tax=Monopterus albus TaxID=43700 RepID=A0A3Q3R911_MONAL
VLQGAQRRCVICSVSPKRKGKCGQKRKTTPRDDAYLIRESAQDPRKTSDVLKVDLKEKGIEVSSSTVCRRLLEVGRKAYRPVKKQLLTKAMKVKRYKWALKYKNWTKEDWRKVLFSDESHFFVQGQRSQLHKEIR